MIYYLDKEVIWNKKTGLNEVEQQVRGEIEAIREKYFGNNKLGYAKVIYPKGKIEEAHRVFGVERKYPLFYTSDDGTWIFAERKVTNRSGNLDYGPRHRLFRYQTMLRENEIELLWFLIHKSSAFNRKLFIEDLEAKAKSVVEEMSVDADLKYLIMGKTSPISKDIDTIKKVAEIFGLRDIEKKGESQLKVELYDTILAGEKRNDPNINYKRFEQLTNSDFRRKAAYLAKRAINDKIVVYKDGAWFYNDNGTADERLVELKRNEIEMRDHVFVDKVVNDANVRARLFAILHEEEDYSRADLMNLGLSTLRAMVKELGGKVGQNETKDTLADRICEIKNITK